MFAQFRKGLLECFEVLGDLHGLTEEFFLLFWRKDLHHGLLEALEDTAHHPDILPPSGFRAVTPGRFVRFEGLEK